MNNVKQALPNILTLINLALGIIAILFAVNSGDLNNNTNVNSLVNASLVIMIAALTDRFDGKIARMLGTTSELGRELDSLSDLISFGVAPIIVSWRICFMDLNLVGYLLALVFPLAGAYRLARFNITVFSTMFTGLPITIAGALLTINNLYSCISIFNNKYSLSNTIITIILTVVMSLLMISKFKIKKI